MLWNVIITQALLPLISFCFLASGYSYHNRPKITVIPRGYCALLIWSHKKMLYYYVISQTPYPWSNYKKNQTQTDDSLQDTWWVLFNPACHGKKGWLRCSSTTEAVKGHRRSLDISETPSLEVSETPVSQVWRFLMHCGGLSTPPLKSVSFH